MSDIEAKAYALADNRTAQLGTYDPEYLLNMLQDVAKVELKGTGYSEHDLQDLLNRLSPPDLDELAAEIGDVEPAREDVALNMRVKKATMIRWADFWANSELDDDQKINELLDSFDA